MHRPRPPAWPPLRWRPNPPQRWAQARVGARSPRALAWSRARARARAGARARARAQALGARRGAVPGLGYSTHISGTRRTPHPCAASRRVASGTLQCGTTGVPPARNPQGNENAAAAKMCAQLAAGGGGRAGGGCTCVLGHLRQQYNISRTVRYSYSAQRDATLQHSHAVVHRAYRSGNRATTL